MSNGGLQSPLNLWILPVFDSTNFGTAMLTFDPTNFNDQWSGSSYSWQVLDVLAGRTPTCNRIIFSYRDLGVAIITWQLFGTNDQGAIVSSDPQQVTIGSLAATGTIFTYVLGINLSAQNLQAVVTRAPLAGPVCITKMRMEGEVEINPYG
jgi:hypothetical protein